VHGQAGCVCVRAYIYEEEMQITSCQPASHSSSSAAGRRAASAKLSGAAAASSDPPYAPHGPTRV
jgi:hypothetical protein